MSYLRELRRGGFSLIETLAALFIFSIITLGIVPLFASSLRGSDLSRSYTVGKNVAVQAMERIRGLPFHRSEPGTLDLLDLYHPTAPAAAGQAFRTVCRSSGIVTASSTAGANSDACPSDIPSNFTLSFDALFVNTDGVAPNPFPANYLSGTPPAVAEPPTGLIDLTVTARWVNQGRSQSYDLQSLVGDVRFGRLKVSAVGRLDYGVRVLTSFSTNGAPAVIHDLVANGGVASSTLQLRTDPSAEQAVVAGELDFVNVSDPDNTVDVETVQGALVVMTAPPDQSSPDVTDGITPDNVVSLVGLGDLAGLDTSTAKAPTTPVGGLKATTAGGLPVAQGSFDFATAGVLPDFWVDHPHAARGTDTQNRLFLTSGVKLVSVTEGTVGGVTRTLSGQTEGATTATTVGSGAHLVVPDLRLFPTTFAPEGVIRVSALVADTNCSATRNAGTDVATATWTGAVSYWSESGPSGVPGYQQVALSGADPGDLLATVPRDTLVFKDPNTNNRLLVADGIDADLVPDQADADDIYLFPTEHEHALVDEATGNPLGITRTHQHPGYLRRWSSNTAEEVNNTDPDGRVTFADIPEALTIQTTPVPVSTSFSQYVPSSLTIGVGSLGCEASDLR